MCISSDAYYGVYQLLTLECLQNNSDCGYWDIMKAAIIVRKSLTPIVYRLHLFLLLNIYFFQINTHQINTVKSPYRMSKIDTGTTSLLRMYK